MAVSLKVLEVLDGNRAIVSTKGLCRVVIMPSGKVHAELEDLASAHRICADCELVDRMRPRPVWFEAIDYATGRVINFDNRGLSTKIVKRTRQTMGARAVGEKYSKYFPTKKKDRVKGFRLGRVLSA